MYIRHVLILLIFLSIQSLYSQTCCSGGIPLSNSLGLSNEGKGSVQLGLHYDYNNLSTLNAGSDKLDDDSRHRITHSALFNIGYSITNRWSVETLFTWVNQRRIINQFGNTDLQQTSGFGDAVVLAKYSFPKILGETSDVTLGAGSKIPLGSFDEVNGDGITYIADLQPGSGAWDIILFASFSKNFKFRPTTTFSARVINRITGENKEYLDGASIYEYGDETQLFFGVTDQFLVFNTIINPGLTFKYRSANRDIIDGNELDNTGGKWLFVIPSLSIKLSPEITFLNKLELPVISNVDGTQLTPTYRFSSGFVFNLNGKKNKINLNSE
ncbi:MAG: hypothetical protein COA50_00660 [Flavobacteriaceae bacterium]|nr:MAG: hypothetical protein COA50_00660 [Flavobacteriaceae bacterium]